MGRDGKERGGRTIAPRNTIDAPAKNKHVREEEGNSRRGRRVLLVGALEAEQNTDHHHGNGETQAAPHHGLASPDAVDEEGGEEGPDHEHALNAAAEDEGEVAGQADVGLEDRRHEVDDQVDPADLVHELHAVGQQDATTGLDVVARQDLAPLVLAVLGLHGDGLEDVVLLGLDLGVVGLAVVDVAEDLQGLVLAAVAVAVAWRLREAEDEDDDHEGEDHLARDGQAPRDGPADEGHAVVEEVGDDDPDANEEGLAADEAATLVGFGEFGLVHGDGAGVDAGADTGDEAGNHELGDAVGGALQRRAHDDPAHSEPHLPPAAEPLADDEIEDAAGEGAEVVDGDDDAGEAVVGVVHRGEEVFVADDSGEDALVVAEEDEGHLAHDHDGELEGQAPAEEVELHGWGGRMGSRRKGGVA